MLLLLRAPQRLFGGLAGEPFGAGALEVGCGVLQRRELRVELGRAHLGVCDRRECGIRCRSRLVGALLCDTREPFALLGGLGGLFAQRIGRVAVGERLLVDALRLLAELRRHAELSQQPVGGRGVAAAEHELGAEVASGGSCEVGGQQAGPHLRDLGDRVGLVGLRTERALALGRLVARVDRLPPRLVGHLRGLHRGIGRSLQAGEQFAETADLGLLRGLVLLGLLDLAPRRVVGRGGGRRADEPDRRGDGADGHGREDGDGLHPRDRPGAMLSQGRPRDRP